MKKPIIVAAILLIFDQLTKYLVVKLVPYGAAIQIVAPFNFFNVTHLNNTGAAFSFFQGANFLFVLLVLVFLIAVCVWLFKNRTKITVLQKYAFALVVAGGAGNLIDRVFRGSVVDFLDFGINNLRWPSFNIADSCITIAAVLIVVSLLKQPAKPAKGKRR